MEYMPLIVFAGVISVFVLAGRAATSRTPRRARRGSSMRSDSFDSSLFSAMDTSSSASSTTDHVPCATHDHSHHGSCHGSGDFGSGHHGGDFGGGHCGGHH